MVAVAITQNGVIEQAIIDALHRVVLEALIRGTLVPVKRSDA